MLAAWTKNKMLHKSEVGGINLELKKLRASSLKAEVAMFIHLTTNFFILQT